MKKSLLILGTVSCLWMAPALGQAQERYQAGQFQVSPFATYVDKVGDNWGLGASLTYYLTKNLGVGATTYWTDFKGPFFDNISAEAYFRLPLFKVVAPYAVGSGGYVFETDEWIGSFGAGVDFQPLKKLTAFGDVQWRVTQETRDGVFLRLGARITF